MRIPVDLGVGKKIGRPSFWIVVKNGLQPVQQNDSKKLGLIEHRVRYDVTKAPRF